MEWLETALDYGISEYDFWNYTISELIRVLESKKRIEKTRLQEKAFFDYTLADTIGISVGRFITSKAHLPRIDEIYPTLFDSEQIDEQLQAQKEEIAIARFKQFAQAHNQKIQEVGEVNE